MKKILTGLLGLVAINLVACEKSQTPAPTNTPTPIETVQSSDSTIAVEDYTTTKESFIDDDDISIWVDYGCDSGKQVRAAYTNLEKNSSANLEIDGKNFSLYSIVTASGAGYASEQGLRPDEGIKWLTKGDEAILVAMILDHTANPDDAPILMRCRVLVDQQD